MYAGNRYAQHPERAAFIMAGSGETVTYAEHERRTNRLAHLLRAEGLKRLDHFAIFMENNSRFLECNGAGERSGLYYTCINSYLTPDELAYIVDNSQSQVLITSRGQAAGGAGGAAPNARASSAAWWSTAATRCVRWAIRATSTSSRPRTATPARRLPTSGSARRCCIRRAPRAGPRASSARCPRTRRRSRCRCSTF